MKSSCWKYPHKSELPSLHTTVLCFTGGQRFGAYELGYLEQDADCLMWVMESRPKDYVVPDAWCDLPDAPEFI